MPSPDRLRRPFAADAARVIVNADDLGHSLAVNDAIFAGMRDGVITSATIMATGPAFEAAIAGADAFPHCSFGVHLNLTWHAPLTGSSALAPLLTSAGEFRLNGVYEVRWTRGLRDAVCEEWIAQIQRVRQAGIRISHIDGHHHVHTIPQLFPVLKRVQRATEIRRVRGTWSIYDAAHRPRLPLRLKKVLWSAALRRLHATQTTDHFGDFLMFLRAVEEGSFPSGPWPPTIELMVHPTGVPEESGAEAAALRSGWLARLPYPCQLVSYEHVFPPAHRATASPPLPAPQSP